MMMLDKHNDRQPTVKIVKYVDYRILCYKGFEIEMHRCMKL